MLWGIPARTSRRIAKSLGSLLIRIIRVLRVTLVDDQSTDGTATIGRVAAAHAQEPDRLAVLIGQPLPPGWAGKLWAVKQGVDHAESLPSPPSYLLFTDADIAFSRDALRHLVARAEAHQFVLTSLMVKLRCESLAERGLLPAFVFFFQMLYPFAWVNRTGNETAAAAGGCMLVRRDALKRAGGIEAIRFVDRYARWTKAKSVVPVLCRRKRV